MLRRVGEGLKPLTKNKSMFESGEQLIISKVDFNSFLEQMQFLRKEIKELKKSVESDKLEAPVEWENNWHSLKFVAEKLGIERTTITYWAKCGKIQKRKIGEKIFIDIKEVHELLNFKQESGKVVPRLHRQNLQAS